MDNQTLASTPCGGETGTALLPVGPFTALHYHFGMLLGVDDFETDQAYHRGKMRLHNAWLHGEGVVWGFGVGINSRRELEVGSGLALDAAGRELHLDGSVCLDIGKWYAKHKEDPALVDKGGDFEGHVVVRFRSCLSRPVPSISEPCVGTQQDTAYSRTQEQVEVLFVPGAPPPKVLPYHRLRVLFSLEEAVVDPDDEVVLRRADIQKLALDDQPSAYLKALREFAALDELDLHPSVDPDGKQTSIFPEDETTQVLLAKVSGTVVKGNGQAWSLGDVDPKIDVRVRPSHVATRTIQELLCGPLFLPAQQSGEPVRETDVPPVEAERPSAPTPPNGADMSSEDSGSSAPVPPTDAGGPRINADSVIFEEGNRIRLEFDTPVAEPSVRFNLSAFSVSAFVGSGWQVVTVKGAIPNDLNQVVSLETESWPNEAKRIRLIAKGTGPTPILGQNLVPLAGAVDGPPGTNHDGNDFVLMIEGS